MTLIIPERLAARDLPDAPLSQGTPPGTAAPMASGARSAYAGRSTV